jgi:hypothetical protein
MAGSARPDGAARRLALVATEIIEDDDVARLQRWGQSLIDTGPEARAVDWTIENPWDLDAITPLATGCSVDVKGDVDDVRGTLDVRSNPGAVSAQSVPFYPTAGQTYYDVGIPGTYDHISASGRPEYNLNTEQQPGAAPVATKTGQHGCGSRCSYPDFGSIAKTAPAGG